MQQAPPQLAQRRHRLNCCARMSIRIHQFHPSPTYCCPCQCPDTTHTHQIVYSDLMWSEQISSVVLANHKLCLPVHDITVEWKALWSTVLGEWSWLTGGIHGNSRLATPSCQDNGKVSLCFDVKNLIQNRKMNAADGKGKWCNGGICTTDMNTLVWEALLANIFCINSVNTIRCKQIRL